jgi:hypothetical protein
LTRNSEEALDSLSDTWYLTNPNDSIEPLLNFPVTVIYEDGSTETANNEDGLDELFEDCFGDDWNDCEKINVSDAVIGSKYTLAKRVIVKTSKMKKTVKSKRHKIK